MRFSLVLSPILSLGTAVASGLAVLALAPAALAQGSTYDCIGIEGGRPMCTPSRDAIYDNLNGRTRARGEEAARERKLVKAVAQAVHDGRCEEALALALKSENPMVAANTARLCGVPDGPPPEMRRDGA